ncbi:MAG: hypothetical protein ABJE95_29140 [Byssovorax sp.]
MTARLAAIALAAALLAPLACGAPTLGELPARCSDGTCPDGFTCVHSVCARPDQIVPITVADLPFLRGVDLRVLPEPEGFLVAWQTYAYGPDGEGFVVARLGLDGSVSAPMRLGTNFAADTGATEPSYDLVRLDDGRLLLAVSAAPLPDDDAAEPRLAAYRITLPSPGNEAKGAAAEPVWTAEARLSTAGYGAVSSPRFAVSKAGVQLAYLSTRVDETAHATIAELDVFTIDPAFKSPVVPTIAATYPARAGLPVAVGVARALPIVGGTYWILDSARPSALFVSDAADAPVETTLARLAIGLTASSGSLTYLRPSTRTGQKLPTDPVAGPAEIHRISQGKPDVVLAGIVPVRDTPGPTWIDRPALPSLLITPGGDVDAEQIGVYSIDSATGKTTTVSFVDRLSSRALAGAGAAVSHGKLAIVWAEESAGSVTVRAAIVGEPGSGL